MSPDRLTYQVGKEGKNTEYRMLFVFLKSLQKILPLLLLLDTFHIRCNVFFWNRFFKNKNGDQKLWFYIVIFYCLDISPAFWVCISESNDGCGPLDNVLSGRVSKQSAGCKINEGTVTEEEKELVKKPCEFWGKKFADEGALKRHLKSYMGIKDFPCSECRNACSKKRARDNHFNIVHLEVNNFPCAQCGKMFGRSSANHVHMTKIHPHAAQLCLPCIPIKVSSYNERNEILFLKCCDYHIMMLCQ